MDHKQLRAFLTVAETGNMTRAAEQLNVVQSAVSRQIQLLEEDIGVQLFQRERHGMALTDAGKSLQGYARRVMLELDRARAELTGSATEVAGIVTVGLLPSTCDVVASPLISAVTRDYPKIRMRLAVGYIETLQQWLEKGEVDVAVLYGVENLPHIHVTPLLTEPLWVVGPASARLRKQRPVPVASLADKPMILPEGPHGVRGMVDYACAMANVTLQGFVETNAMSVQKGLVLGGHGYTILPPISFATELASGALTGAPLTAPEISRTLQLALPANRTVGRPVRCVVDLVVKCIHEAVTSNRWPEARWVAKEQ
ncbi:MAG TPA: LysR substrate-binding domain-containing protein [Ramlibacter sp.]|nr:LysR substrate-binding domain-containing protein [Ramlibacter sp.]